MPDEKPLRIQRRTNNPFARPKKGNGHATVARQPVDKCRPDPEPGYGIGGPAVTEPAAPRIHWSCQIQDAEAHRLARQGINPFSGPRPAHPTIEFLNTSINAMPERTSDIVTAAINASPDISREIIKRAILARPEHRQSIVAVARKMGVYGIRTFFSAMFAVVVAKVFGLEQSAVADDDVESMDAAARRGQGPDGAFASLTASVAAMAALEGSALAATEDGEDDADGDADDLDGGQQGVMVGADGNDDAGDADVYDSDSGVAGVTLTPTAAILTAAGSDNGGLANGQDGLPNAGPTKAAGAELSGEVAQTGVATAATGHIKGEMAAIEPGKPRSATVQVRSKTAAAWRVSGNAFRRMWTNCGDFNRHFLTPIRRACDKLDQRTGPAPRPPRLRATC